MTGDVRRGVSIIDADGAVIQGDLVVPQGAPGVVVFAHGSGSGRHSPRNRMVAASLQRRGLATLLIDLLTTDEEAVDLRTRALRFDIALLADRLAAASGWLADDPATGGLGGGYFGASTGAAAALVAAARHPDDVAAVVCRGGRPDLAGDWLPRVQAPTLLIVGGLDPQIIALNQAARERLVVERSLQIVDGASHLFEEPGALEHVARLAGDWFGHHLAAAPASTRSRS